MLAVAAELPTFGGFWYNDRDQVVIGLTDLNDLPLAVELVRPHLGSHLPTGGFVGAQVRFTFEGLARYRKAMETAFEHDGVFGLSVKESENRIYVDVSSASAAVAVIASAAAAGIPEGVVFTRESQPPTLDSHSLSVLDSVIEGGRMIASEAGHLCTLGFSAVRADGSTAWVTNTHCTYTKNGFDARSHFSRAPFSTYELGSEILDPSSWTCLSSDCRNSDAALISADYSFNLGMIARTTNRVTLEGFAGDTTIDHTNPTIAITSSNNNVYQNETLEKIGRKTGWTAGAVEDTCVDYEVDYSTVLCSDRVDYHSDNGDSGSPVFYLKSNGTAELRGIHFGRHPIYADALMSDLGQIQADLGQLIVVDKSVSALVYGETSVPPNGVCDWEAVISPGWPPYSSEWRRDGVLVSTATAYHTSDTGTSDFQLTYTVTDARNDSDFIVLNVDVDPNDTRFSCDPL